MQQSGMDGFSNNDPAEIYERICRYCSYQERCTFDAAQKLGEWKVPAGKAGLVIKRLKTDGYIDDDRFARLFVRSKFRNNKWGRVKLGYELRGRKIPEKIISEALKEISDENYRQTIRNLILKKKSEIKPGKNLTIREKIITFVIGKGFEFDLAAEVLKELKL